MLLCRAELHTSSGSPSADLAGDPARLSASRRRSSERVPPVRRAASGSLGKGNSESTRGAVRRLGWRRWVTAVPSTSCCIPRDRKSVVLGKSVDLGGRRILKKNK